MQPRQYLDSIGLFSHNPLNGVGLWSEEMTLFKSLLPLKPFFYVETGSWNGGSLLISHFHRTQNNLSGWDMAIDPNFSPYFDLNMRRANCKPKKCVGTIDNIAEWITEPIDVAFIDGLHSFSQACKDFYGLKPYLNPGATIIFHDCSPRLQKDRSGILAWTLDHLDELKSHTHEDFYCDEAYCYLEHTEDLTHIDCQIDCFHPQETGLTTWVRGKTSPSSAIAAMRYKCY